MANTSTPPTIAMETSVMTVPLELWETLVTCGRPRASVLYVGKHKQKDRKCNLCYFNTEHLTHLW